MRGSVKRIEEGLESLTRRIEKSRQLLDRGKLRTPDRAAVGKKLTSGGPLHE